MDYSDHVIKFTGIKLYFVPQAAAAGIKTPTSSDFPDYPDDPQFRSSGGVPDDPNFRRDFNRQRKEPPLVKYDNHNDGKR